MKATIFLIMSMLFHTIGLNQIEVKGIVSDFHGNPIPGVKVSQAGSKEKTFTNLNGEYSLFLQKEGKVIFELKGYEKKEYSIKFSQTLNVVLTSSNLLPEEDVEIALESEIVDMYAPRVKMAKQRSNSGAFLGQTDNYTQWNTEEYNTIHENFFHSPKDEPLSTFSIDVDAASYANVRRFINNGQLPPKDAVRIEEMINYFNYDYEAPNQKPFSVSTSYATAPWNESHKLLHIGIKGKEIAKEDLPPSNLVFLIDVSGSMGAPNKLPLLKSSFKLLTEQLRSVDRVAIVVYAGAAGAVLPSTPGNEKDEILASLERLNAGGSTAGGAGIKLAYKIAKENFIEGGNNRIILATDGDFNVGESSNASMERLVEEKRNQGVFLTVLGFGMGNYKDSKMEILADKGNGNYAYIDTINEAKKVLISEFGGTLFTIAKDVKLQIEFNPEIVAAYRLIGYENRMLNKEDFNDDKKDAGELGAGHTVTALYEIIPQGIESEFIKDVDPLYFQKQEKNQKSSGKDEVAILKLRYKEPQGETSKLISSSIKDKSTSWRNTDDNLKWSSTVASFGMILRDSKFKGTSSFDQVLLWAKQSKGEDLNGYRSEFIRMVESSSLMARK